MRFARVLIVTLPLLMLLACGQFTPSRNSAAGFQTNVTRNAAHPWSNLRFKNNPADFHFAIISDRTGGARPGVFEDAIRKVNLLEPEFVINVGDLIEGYTTNSKELVRQRNDVDATLGRLEMPFFYVPGNHDVNGEQQRKIWNKRYGPTYYHFVYKNVLFICINAIDGLPGDDYKISDTQIDYFRSAIKDNPNVRWTCVFLHVPFWLNPKPIQEKKGWMKMEELLKGRPFTVFAGHLHTYMMYNRNGNRYYRLATTGAESRMRGPARGEFDEIMWVTMTDKGPRVANIDLTGIYDENVRTEESGKLFNAFKLSSGWIFADSGLFRSGTTSLSLTNSADLPVRVSLQLNGNRALSVTPTKLETVIPPHTSQTLTVHLASVAPLNPSLLDPVSIEGTARYNLKVPGAADNVVESKLKAEIGVRGSSTPHPLPTK